jgi:hypothetical protein
MLHSGIFSGKFLHAALRPDARVIGHQRSVSAL